jgi:hypothetical protein
VKYFPSASNPDSSCTVTFVPRVPEARISRFALSMSGPCGLAAQPRREVERAAPVAALHPDGLSGVEADPHRQGERGVVDRLLRESQLQIDRGPEGLAS